MAQEPVSIDRRMFLALVTAGSAVAAGSLVNRLNAERRSVEPIMTLDQVYQITPNYYVGPKQERPPANEASGTIWEVTAPNRTQATRRTISDGERWITLSVEPGGLDSATRPGEYYLTPEDGIEGIQEVIDRTGGNVVVRLAPGQYVGSELTLAHGVVLVGSGPNATTITLENGANTDLITTPNPPTNNAMECSLQNITFEGNKKNNKAGNLVYGAFWNSRFLNCRFSGAPENGFWLAGSKASTDDNYFNGCQFINNGDAGLRGGGNKQSFPAVGVVRVDTNWFGHNGGPAIVARGNSWKITNSKLYHNANQRGASITLNRCSYSAVSGCDSYMGHTDRNHISVRAAKGVSSVGNQIKHNDFRGEYNAAIRCRGAGEDVKALQIHGNTIQSSKTAHHGIVASAEDDGSFVSCSFKDNVLVGAITRTKIDLPAGWLREGNLSSE